MTNHHFISITVVRLFIMNFSRLALLFAAKDFFSSYTSTPFVFRPFYSRLRCVPLPPRNYQRHQNAISPPNPKVRRQSDSEVFLSFHPLSLIPSLLSKCHCSVSVAVCVPRKIAHDAASLFYNGRGVQFENLETEGG